MLCKVRQRFCALPLAQVIETMRPLPVDDPTQRCPDISRARNLLEWEPRVPLEIGLERTIAYFNRLLCQRGEISEGKLRLRA